MKFWNIPILIFFINFLIMPSIISVFNLDIPQNNIIIAEEEVHTPGNYFTEKNIPKTLNIKDFIEALEEQTQRIAHNTYTERYFLSPYISIISPPPDLG